MTKCFEIAGRAIGADAPVYVIAEIGFNHGGDMALAGAMIRAAAEAGAEAVKFQTYKATDIAAPTSEHFDLIREGELSRAQHQSLKDQAEAAGVAFLSTPFSVEAVDLLDGIGVGAFKVASMDLDNLPLLAHIAGKGKPVLLSTGMGTADEILRAVETLEQHGCREMAVLHCLSDYPAKAENANLASIAALAELTGYPAGYSDHTLGCEVALAAAGLGASVIEKHFTTDKTLAGPDHAISADPAELRHIVQGVRDDGGKDFEAFAGVSILNENRPDRGNAAVFRRGLYAAVNIAEGEVISARMIKAIRPAGSLGPTDLQAIIGSRAGRDFSGEEALSRGDLK